MFLNFCFIGILVLMSFITDSVLVCLAGSGILYMLGEEHFSNVMLTSAFVIFVVNAARAAYKSIKECME